MVIGGITWRTASGPPLTRAPPSVTPQVVAVTVSIATYTVYHVIKDPDPALPFENALRPYLQSGLALTRSALPRLR
jgi:hypothetical protein